MADARRKRRFGRGRAALLVVLGGAGMIAAGHAYWGAHAGWELARETAALRAAGEPVTTADLMQPDVPDERNAVVLLREAAASVDMDSEALAAFDGLEMPAVGSRLPLARDERAVMTRVVSENRAAFRLIGDAAALDTGIDWDIDYTKGFGVVPPDLGGSRTLANLLAAAALLAHERGEDAHAIELLDRIAFIDDAVGSQSMLLSFLISTGVSQAHAATLAELAPDLAIGSRPDEVPPARVRRLIDELLDDRARRDVWLRGMRGERVLQQDAIARLLSGEWTTGGLTTGAHPKERRRVVPYVLGPAIKEDGRILRRFMSEAVDAGAKADDWPAFRALVPENEPVELNDHPWRHPFATILLPSIHRATQAHYRHLGYRHLTAAALAARLYALDHDGNLPGSLDDLVPEYLPRVPLDTLAAGGKPVRYVADGQRPRVYHVGPNGVDDGGREGDPGATRAENDRVRDEVVHLRRQPRPRPAAGDKRSQRK